jgi:hypothetical protein
VLRGIGNVISGAFTAARAAVRGAAAEPVLGAP